MTKTIPTVLSTSQPERMGISSVREMIAAMLLARDECVYSKPIPSDLISWGGNLIRAGKDAEHSGDCTNECHTCNRCLADWTLQHADQFIAALAATPAVGGEPLNFPYQRTFDAICAAVNADKTPPFAIHVSVKAFQEAFNNHRDAAAQPASPLRGRDEWQDALDKWAKANLPSESAGCITSWSDLIAEFIIASPPEQPASPLRGRMLDQAEYKLGWWLAGALEDPNVCTEMKDVINKWFEAHQPNLVMSASSASPPEQPAADPVTGREELIEQCAKIAEPWSGFIDADKMGAADNAVIKVRNDIAAAIRSLKETQT